MKQQGHLFLVAAPSGTGKTSLVRALVEQVPGVEVSISHTTRPRRSQESDGVNYFFIDDTAFDGMVEKKAFLEHAKVFGNQYGTHAGWVQQRLAAGVDVILEIDWQGAAQVKASHPDAIGVFVLPPSKAELSRRLHAREQDSDQVMARRLAEAGLEISQAESFNYIIINDKFEDALADMAAVVSASRCQLHARRAFWQKLLAEF
jgi:guanylate kinase